MVGFKPDTLAVTVGPGQSVRLDFEVSPVAVSLAEFRVVGEAAGSSRRAAFEARRKLGRGWFIGEDAIRGRAAVHPSDFLRTLPVVYLHTLEPTASIRLRGIGGAKCNATLVVNGIVFRGDELELAALAGIDRLIGIEVYSGGRMLPRELLHAWSDCGVVAFWTDDDEGRR
jgi:hypothetical protein